MRGCEAMHSLVSGSEIRDTGHATLLWDSLRCLALGPLCAGSKTPVITSMLCRSVGLCIGSGMLPVEG